MKNIFAISNVVRRVSGTKTADGTSISASPLVYLRRYLSSEPALKEQSSSSSNASSEEDPEWKAAKPFEQLPGYRDLPGLGTLWVMLPVVGR